MKNNVIDFETAKLRIGLKRFATTGRLSAVLLENDSLRTKAYSAGCYDFGTIQQVETILKQSRLDAYIDMQSNFNTDYAIVTTNLRTLSTDFMFPGILNHYRRGINPVTALYNSLQEALFKHHEHNKVYDWTIRLFNNKGWLQSLLSALKQDVKDISHLIKTYANSNSSFISKQLKHLRTMQENFKHYAEVFVLVQDWIKENNY